MNILQAIQESGLVYRLGWTLAHSLWLGAAAATLLAVALLALRRASSNVRYLAACAAMVALLAATAVTFCLVQPPARQSQPVIVAADVPQRVIVSWSAGAADVPAAVPAAHGSLSVQSAGPRHVAAPAAPAAAPAPKESLAGRASKFLEPALPWIVLAWVAGVFMMSLWELSGWIAASRIRRLATQPSRDDMHTAVARLAAALHIRKHVRVLLSSIVKAPTLIGWLRPAILLPASLASGMSVGQLDAILLHELAHVRRWDYLVNLLQRLVETLLFYHPAVWFISRAIRVERENCCDDITVGACGDATLYADALVAAAAGHKAGATSRLAVAANGGKLLPRIRRILNVPAEGPARSTLLPIALAVALAAAVIAVPTLTSPAQPASSPSATSKPTSTPATQTTERIAWGQPVGGLEMGLSLAEESATYDPGEVADVIVHLRNRSDSEIVTCVELLNGRLVHFRSPTPVVRDAGGQEVKVTHPMPAVAPRVNIIRLAAGDSQAVGSFPLRLGKNRRPGDPSVMAFVAESGLGKYTASLTYPFQKLDRSANWAGQLTSGDVAMLVGKQPATRATQPATTPARTVLDVQKERDQLLSQADLQLRQGLKELAKSFPQLAVANNMPLEEELAQAQLQQGKLCLWVGRSNDNDHSKAPYTPESIADDQVWNLMVVIEPEGGPVTAMAMFHLYPRLGLVGQHGASAADPKLDAALNKLLADALAPLAALDRQGSTSATQATSELATQPGPASAPATQPADGIAAEGLLTRVYDVRDFVFRIKDVAVPDYWDSFGQRLYVPQSSPASQAVDQELLDELIKEIEEVVAPDSWKTTGRMRWLKGNLVITQTAKNHADISALIDHLRAARSARVRVDVHVIQYTGLTAEKGDTLATWLSKNVQAKLDEKTGSLNLSEAEALALLGHVGSSVAFRTIAAPRLNVFNGQRTRVITADDRAISLPRLDKKNETFATTAWVDGAVLAVQPTVDEYRKAVQCDVTAWAANSVSSGKVPEVAIGEAKVISMVPAKQTMLLRIPMVRNKIDGVTPAADGAKLKVQHTPLEKPEQAKEFVYILVRPQSFICEIEVDPVTSTQAAVSAIRHAATAPATQPAAQAAGRLEFRIAPSPSAIDKIELENYRNWLKAGRVGFWWKDGRIRGRMPEHAWLPIADVLEGFPGYTTRDYYVTGEFEGRKYLLVSDKPGEMMVPGEGKDAWAVAKAFVTTDPVNRPAVGFELDDRGTELLTAFTKANIGNALAILVDDTVYSATISRAAMGRGVVITGLYTDQEAKDLATALSAGIAKPRPAASIPAASRPTTQVSDTQPAGTMITRVYDIRDLLLQVSTVEPLRVWSRAQPTTQPFKLEDKLTPAQQKLAQQKLAEQFIADLQRTFDPPSWKANGGSSTAVFLNGTLVVTQSEANHRAVAAQLEARRKGRDRQIQVESRFLSPLSQKQDADLRQWIDKQLKAKFDEMPDKKSQSLILDNAGVDSLIRHWQEDKTSRTLTAPRLHLLNGEDANLTICTAHPLLMSPLGQPAIFAYFYEGTMLDVNATTSDGSYVTVSVHPVATRLISDKPNPQYMMGESNLTFKLPSKATVMVRMPMVRMKVTGLQEVKDAGGEAKQYDVLSEPVDKNTKPDEFMYMLVKPIAIAPAEAATKASATGPASAPGTATTITAIRTELAPTRPAVATAPARPATTATAPMPSAVVEPIDPAEVRRKIAALALADETLPYEQRPENWLSMRRDRIMPQLIAGMDDKNANVAKGCLNILGRNQSPGPLPKELTDALVVKAGDYNSSLRYGALRLLEKAAADPRAVKIFDEASAQADSSSDPLDRARWANLAGQKKRSVDILRPLITSGKSDYEVYQAIRLLGEVAEPTSISLLEPMAAGDNWGMAREAKLALAKIDPVAHGLTKDQVTMLTSRGGKETSEHHNERVMQLAALNAKEVRPLVMQMLRDKSGSQSDALLILSVWKDKAALDQIRALMLEKRSFARQQAVAAMLTIQDDKQSHEEVLALLDKDANFDNEAVLGGIVTADIPVDSKVAMLEGAQERLKSPQAVARAMRRMRDRGQDFAELLRTLMDKASDVQTLGAYCELAGADKDKRFAPEVKRAISILADDAAAMGGDARTDGTLGSAGQLILSAAAAYDLKDRADDVKKLMGSKIDVIRQAAQTAGAKLNVPGAANDVYAQLGDEKATVRARAATALLGLKPADEAERQAREGAVLSLLGKPSEDYAMRVLATCGGPKTVKALTPILDDEDTQRAVYAAWVLAQLSDKAAADKGLRRVAIFAMFQHQVYQQGSGIDFAIAPDLAFHQVTERLNPGQAYSAGEGPVRIPADLLKPFPLDDAEQKFVVAAYRASQQPRPMHMLSMSFMSQWDGPGGRQADKSYLALLKVMAAEDTYIKKLMVKGQAVPHFEYRQLAAQQIATITKAKATYIGLAGEVIDSQASPQPYKDQDKLLATFVVDRIAAVKPPSEPQSDAQWRQIEAFRTLVSHLRDQFGQQVVDAVRAEAAERKIDVSKVAPKRVN